jgi:predicted nucleotidyltransferase component of viral defense system
LAAGSYPTSVEEIAIWQRQDKTTLLEARRRFVQFVVLTAISSSPGLATRITFKRGNALWFIHGNPRGTIDLDFTAEGNFPDEPTEITGLIDAALKSAQNQFRVKARCQSIHRNPSKLDKTFPTYDIKVCFQLPTDRYYQNFEERKRFAEVIQLEISLNDIVCETISWKPSASRPGIRCCSLEDQIAEKLRALLQQVPRKRTRPQDVFDIASKARERREKLDLGKISAFLLKKCEGRIDSPRKGSFDNEVRRHAEAVYAKEIGSQTSALIPFEDAWGEVLQLVRQLSIPE